MNENRVSIEISQADIDAVNQAVQTLNEKLAPYLIALEAGDKQALAKMKDKSAPFVEKILQYVNSNAEFVPAFLDTAEMKKDYQAFNALNNILRSLAQIVSNLEDTSVLCGSESYQGALAYYNSVKQAKKMNVPNADAIYQDLSVRFEAQRAKISSKPIQ
jgi:hypothetical protein